MSSPPSERTRVKRYHWLAQYEPQTIHAILDAMPVCNVAYLHEGRPVVTPTLQWREGDRIYWHGSAASRMIRAVTDQEVCLTVSIFDGLVLARSAYNFNINHRSVMIFGTPERIDDPQEKQRLLARFVDGFVPGQWARLRPVTELELKATTVLSMPITEASAKVRTGPPEDEAEDYAFPVWAGVVPVRMVCDPPVPDPRNLPEVEMPDAVGAFKIG